jgi:hypothetical protein
MTDEIGLVAVGISLAYLLFIARLVRRRQLREKYAMLWMAVGGGVVVMSLSRGPMDDVAQALGIHYGPSILFLLAIMFLMAVVAHLSYEVSRLEERTRRLAEEMALMQPRNPDRVIDADRAPASKISDTGAAHSDLVDPPVAPR